MSRFKNSVRNSAVVILCQIITSVLAFSLRHTFIAVLGEEYLGVGAVMESMAAILSVLEMGIGSTVAFMLYAPVSDNDEEKISALMAFYKRAYRTIGTLTFFLGLLLTPFLKIFLKTAAISISEARIIYIICLVNISSDYFLSYKRTLINAYQNNYLNTLNQCAFAVLSWFLRILSLRLMKNYEIYLIISLVCGFLSDAAMAEYCDRKYPYLNERKRARLTAEDKATIRKNVVSMLFQRAGAAGTMATRNLLISWTNVALMGSYSNYTMLVGTVARVVMGGMHAISGSLGNLMAQKGRRNKYDVYEKLTFVNFTLCAYLAALFSGCAERFIMLIGGGILGKETLFLIILGFFINSMRQPNMLMIEAAGLFGEIRLKVVFEVVINFFASSLFLSYFQQGICGILLGGIIASVLSLLWETYTVHRYAFGMEARRYGKKLARYFLIGLSMCAVSYVLCENIAQDGVRGLLAAFCLSSAAALLHIIFIALSERICYISLNKKASRSY